MHCGFEPGDPVYFDFEGRRNCVGIFECSGPLESQCTVLECGDSPDQVKTRRMVDLTYVQAREV